MTRVVRQGPQFHAPAAQAKPQPKKLPGKGEKQRIAKPGGTIGEGVEEASRPETPGEASGEPSAEAAHHAAHAAGWLENDREVGEKRDAKDEAAESEERKEGGDPKGPQAASKGATATQRSAQSSLSQKTRDAFTGAGDLHSKQGGSTQQTDKAKAAAPVIGKDPVSAVKTMQALGNEQALKHPKPPDAFTVLHAAQPPGVFFKEDAFREGHTEDQEDPELSAAVEEVVRLLFGVKGVLRVGPGVNQAEEPVVVVVATQGFGEQAMRAIPEKVHRFATLVAVPYDLLPLKKDRF